ncbi:MAG: formimidoylglutamate deiminase [Alcanivoracaceae bacterium]|nr:formimidoylglutamate deiminase [Alcanivoracaceae bacterium]
MNNYFFKQALLPQGWQDNVSVTIDSDGVFQDVSEDSKQHPSDIVIDCIIPAMPNCHSHVFQRTMAGLTEYKTSDNDSFWSWRNLMYQYANKIDARQLYHIARYAYSEMLLAGFTSVCEFHYIHRSLSDKNNTEDMSLAIINAAHDVGIRLTLLPVLYTQAHINGSPLSDLQHRFKLSSTEYIELYKSLEKQLFPEQNMAICFHSLRAVSIEQMAKVLRELDKGQTIHIHISEQVAEVEQVIEHSGMRPVELLFHHFDVDQNWCLVHATHLNNHEIELITQSGAIVGLCPMTEANLGDGIFPLSTFIKQKGCFAIGSDSHILINPFQELQILEYSQRLQMQQRIIASTKNTANVGTLLWNESVKAGAITCAQPVDGIQAKQLANWLNIDTQHPLLTNLNGEKCLDTIIFVSNQIKVDTYIYGQKYQGISKNIIENYKNTLKSLR